MLEFHIRKILANILCAFVPSKNMRFKLRQIFGVGKILVPLKDSDSHLPSSVLAKIQANPPLKFIESYGLQNLASLALNASSTLRNQSALANSSLYISPPPITQNFQ